ncbi:putative DNA modification/repair radical SAM protein [Clostridiaceae bacterium]|nr:putative DNA modification/repair radical SAM protein [Clostridiaceae bacterium]RKI16799.1 putative DNA modification/repair radical SAM protein [bacterium 1XD21-70]
MLIQEEMGIQEKLRILSDAAKYDVSCSSSGIARKGKQGTIGNTLAAGICHSFAADGRCISLLKILFTNQCIYDCRYCVNRCSNDVVRTAFTPAEVCTLTIEFYRRNYIEGLFLSSGILYSPDYTMEQIYETLYRLRNEYHFNGYIHVKAIPGASPELIERMGFLTDRMSVNLELPTAEGLKRLAPGKSREKILAPMRQVQRGIAAQNLKALGESRPGGGRLQKRLEDPGRRLADSPNPWWDFKHGSLQTRKGGLPGLERRAGDMKKNPAKGREIGMADTIAHPGRNVWAALQPMNQRLFVPAGQSTQMIVGATPESDYHMIRVAEALYQNYDLKRVFYSAFVRVNDDGLLPVLPGGPPLLREHRLYQADWLLRFYGFGAEELLSEERPNFNILLDPKCDWALRHLERFPVEVNRADYAALLRVPGLGVKSARRIVAARRGGALDFPDLKKMGVVLKRAMYFLTCSGRTMVPFRLDEDFITSQLVSVEHKKAWDIENHGSYRQLSLFDDYQIAGAPVSREDMASAVTGLM